ncbi:MAG: hypothetical protein ACI3ZZ_05375 [Candidatus Aphodosoma sp.]
MTKKIFLIPFLVFILFSCSQESDLIKVSNQSESSIANSPASLLNARDNIIAEYSDVFSNTLIFDSWSEADSTSSLLVNMNVAELSDFQQQHDFSGRAFNSFLYFATVENVVISNLNLNPELLDELSYEKEEAYDYLISDILTNTNFTEHLNVYEEVDEFSNEVIPVIEPYGSDDMYSILLNDNNYFVVGYEFAKKVEDNLVIVPLNKFMPLLEISSMEQLNNLISNSVYSSEEVIIYNVFGFNTNNGDKRKYEQSDGKYKLKVKIRVRDVMGPLLSREATIFIYNYVKTCIGWVLRKSHTNYDVVVFSSSAIPLGSGFPDPIIIPISGFKYSSCISDPRKKTFGMYYYMNTFPYIVDVTGNVSNWRHLSINF